MSQFDDPDKLLHCNTPIFQFDGYDLPGVEGCSGWLNCELIPELHHQQTHDLLIGKLEI